MFGLGIQELVIVGVVAVLLFGRKLPDVAKSLGTSYREFKKGLTDIQSSVHSADFTAPTTNTSYSSSYDYDDSEDPTAPKFEPPPAEPSADSE